MIMKLPWYKNRFLGIGLGALLFVVIVTAGYHIAYAGRIWPGVRLGDLSVGGMTRQSLQAIIFDRVESLQNNGLPIQAEDRVATISLDNIEADVVPERLADQAWSYGRSGSWLRQLGQRITSPFTKPVLEASISFDSLALRDQIDVVAEQLDIARKDVRLAVSGTQVKILYDTQPGKVIDRESAEATLVGALLNLRTQATALAVQDDIPFVNAETAPEARKTAERMISAPLILAWDDGGVTISRQEIGKWIISGAEGDKLIALPDKREISAYVTTVAARANIAFQKPKLVIGDDGKVIEFIPPRSGRVLDEDKTISEIISELERRAGGKSPLASISLTFESGQTDANQIDPTFGITELIGKATTTFDGSPNNRISNIKNGVRFLSGSIIKPGEEFSTVKTLGVIDNTTGYLPELVIKGDQTIPEFGGGLCQVSTTLFRALLNAGLPITARRSHSYRVSYYEKDGAGRWIGPGLDATVYEPNPDLKFRNDTGHPVLIYGYVQGTRVTFELYGTKDGRTSQVIGPKIIAEFPAGEPVYVDTDTLPKGTVKQIEKPHPGGITTATYKITYADGSENVQEFKSSYRRWPAKFLVGTGVGTSGSSQ